MRYILFLLFLLGWFGSMSQDQGLENVDEIIEDEISRVNIFEGNFSMYAPLDVFSEKIESGLLYGFTIGYLRQLQKEKPSFIGIEAYHMNLGIYSRNYNAFVGNEQLDITGKVSSNALGLNLNYRYYLPLKYGRLEPYIDGQLGTKLLYSYLSESGVFSDEEPYDNFDYLSGNWVLTYGGAFGLQIHISDNYFLNLKTTYHFAISGEYDIKKTEDLGSIEFPEEAFETVQSSTNVVKIDIGFTVLF